MERVCKPSFVFPHLYGCEKAVIYLDGRLPARSPFGSDLPEPHNVSGRHWALFGLAGGGVCHAGDVTIAAVRSYRTISPLPLGGIFSVALSRGSLPVAVSHHPALSCSDFPPIPTNRDERPPHPLQGYYIIDWIAKSTVTDKLMETLKNTAIAQWLAVVCSL